MEILRGLNLFLRVLLEIALVVAAFYVGRHLVAKGVLQWVLALGLPLLVIVIWSIFMAPRSPHRLAKLPRVIAELSLFGAALVGLIVAKQPVAAAGLAAAVVLNELFLLLWEE